MAEPKKGDADKRFRRIAMSGKPITRERALEALSALMAAGRVRSPSRGGPPPEVRGIEDADIPDDTA